MSIVSLASPFCVANRIIMNRVNYSFIVDCTAKGKSCYDIYKSSCEKPAKWFVFATA